MTRTTSVTRTCSRPGCGQRFQIAVYSPLNYCSQACERKDKK
jgi:hypothetical protein